MAEAHTGALLTQPETTDKCFVSVEIEALEVIELPATLGNQLQQTTARVVILFVDLEMLGQLTDSNRKQSDLNLRRTGVLLVRGVFFDYFSFFSWMKHGLEAL
jgi:hypothetical protein